MTAFLARSSHLLSFVLSSVVALGCGARQPAAFTLASSLHRDLGRSVFQIVVPRVEHETAEYKQPLPVELLPFAERSDKFVAIGSAFAISPTRFVTAAHVLPLLGSYSERFFLRDASGATYEIARIIGYSQYRDLVELEVVRPPANVVPLEPRTTVAVGEPIATVGNALGEGVVLREGTLTSFTPEPLAGRWRNLRFTAPASPGNSGGPLIDAAGRVLGVVVRRSDAENLNYAVPIGELQKLSQTQTEFWLRGLQVREDRQQLLKEWKLASRLPASLPVLREAARGAWKASLDQWFSELELRFKASIFPNHPGIEAFLRAPDIPFGLGRFELDSNDTWKVAGHRYERKLIASGQTAQFYGAPDESGGELLLERTASVPLEMLFEAPTAIADALVHNYSWAIPFAGQQIGIESLGAPSEHERWVDDYGRPWFAYVWEMRRTDEVLVVDCLTNPAGWACSWKRASIMDKEAIQFAAKRFANRVTLSYYGQIDDWVEFLALAETYRPKLFAGAVVRLEDSLSLSLAPFVGEIGVPLLSKRSMLFVYPSPDSLSPHGQRIVDLSLVPQSGQPHAFGVRELRPPIDQSSAQYGQYWKALEAGAPPYDGAPHLQEGTNLALRAVRPAAVPALYLYFCRSGDEDSMAELQETCDKLQETLKVASPLPSTKSFP